MQNLRRVDKNSGQILSRLWTEVHDILKRYRKPVVVFNTLALNMYIVFRSNDISLGL